jgi:membrane protein
MHANPKRVQDAEPVLISQLPQAVPQHTLEALILRFLRLLRLAFWRAFQHDAFAIAKASAYSSILTFFPALLVVGSVLVTSQLPDAYLREVSYALGKILPAGSATALSYLRNPTHRPIGLLITASLITWWTASGVIISWMEGFRRSYELPHTWGLVKERAIACSLVILAGIPLTFATTLVVFGSSIETRILFHLGHAFGPLILLMWTAIRWLIATLTSIAVIALIYHNAVPRTQPWHSVLPGATLATVLWFLSTALFGWYLRHYSDYSVIYGSLGAGIALLVWMYDISLVILVGAEFNAMLFPRAKTPQLKESN